MISTNLQDVHFPVDVQELLSSITTRSLQLAPAYRHFGVWTDGKTRADDRDAHALLAD